MSADNEVDGDSKAPSCAGCCCCCCHKHRDGHANGDTAKKSIKKSKSKKAKKSKKADANGTINGVTDGATNGTPGDEPVATTTDAADESDDDKEDDDAKSTKSGDEAEAEDGEEKKKQLPPIGSVVEVKNIYRSPKDDDGEWTWQTEEPTDIEEAAENEETATYVLVVRNRKSQDSRKRLEADSIVVQSPTLRAALAEILKDYTGVACELKRLIFEAPFAPFVHRWADFIAYRDKPDLDPVLKSHIELLHGVLQYEIGDSIKSVDDYVKNAVITYEHLWMILQPGSIVLSAHKGPLSGFELVETEYGQNQCGKFLSVRCDCVDYSGKDFGRFREEIRISEFIGTKKIVGLKVYPWVFHPDREKVALKLTARGQLFESLAGHHYKAYSGKAITWDREGNEQPIQVAGRIVIDIDSFNRFSPYSVRYISDWTPRDQERLSEYKAKVEKDKEEENAIEKAGATESSTDHDNQAKKAKSTEDTITATASDQESKQDASQPKAPEINNIKADQNGHKEQDATNKENIDPIEDATKEENDKEKVMLTPYHHMLCRCRTRGYSLKIKEWLDFYVEQVAEITWNNDAFDRLVLPEDQKELIMAFSESQLRGTSSFDDFIVGKGKGIICLLSGPPGVGKTLTAEALAESLRVPLHTLTSGDLGSHAWEVETGLQRILELVSRWNAILLLDECDVFLEERTALDLERNKVISVFLKTLEYYEGVLFLTTNRVENIDLAFQSRIHVSIEYPDLTAESRRTIWRNFVNSSDEKSEISESDIVELSQISLNGRQIKNVLKTAGLLALRKRMPLKRSFIDTVLTIEKKRPGVNNTYTAQLYT